MHKYLYKGFGLNIASVIELPELMPGDGEADVEIILGMVDGVDPELSEDKLRIPNQDEIVYQLKNVAGCKVSRGEKVIIQPANNITNATLRLLILTSIMSCIFIQRRMVPVHGSSIVTNGRCIILAGASGAGKSTLTSAFLERGFQFLSDDVSIITVDKQNHLWVEPGYPYRKLRRDSADYFSVNTCGLEQIEYEEEKYLVPAISHYMERAVPLKVFIQIIPDDIARPDLKEVTGICKLNVIMDNLYRGRLTSYFNQNPFYFTRLGLIAARLDVYILRRPRNGYTCNQQIDLVLNRFTSDERRNAV